MPRLADPRFAPDCEIVFDGQRVPARRGESVASALLAAGKPLLARSHKYHRARGPFCLTGSCGSCLARIDGRPNQRACRTGCRPGLAVESQNAILGAAHDLLGVVDRLYARGLDHHRLMTWNRYLNRAAVVVSRQLAGLGKLPSSVPDPSPLVREERFDGVVVGAGPAGLGAAEALAARGRRALLVDESPAAGGRLRARLELPGDPPLAWTDEVIAAVRRAGGEVALSSTAAGLWQDGGPVLAVAGVEPPFRLRAVRAPSVILATGTLPQPPELDDGDLPGVLAARGALALLADHGVLPGRHALVLGAGAEADAVAARLAAAGLPVQRLDGARAARGRGRVSGVVRDDGTELACDVVLVSGRGLPAAELARVAGARFRFDAATGGYELEGARVEGGQVEGARLDRQRLAPGVLGAGELLTPMTAAEAAESGRRTAAQAEG